MSADEAAAPASAAAVERRRRYPLAKVKGGWTADEDLLLKKLVDELGEGNWSNIARRLNVLLDKAADTGRIGKQCRERYNHHLRPDIRKDAWTAPEEQLLVQAHLRFGNRWSDIAKVISGRTENAVKNHWNATLRRKDADRGCGSRVPGQLHLPHKDMQQQQQSNVLKEYMASIHLLPPGLGAPGPATAGSQPLAAAAAAAGVGCSSAAEPTASASSGPAAPAAAHAHHQHGGSDSPAVSAGAGSKRSRAASAGAPLLHQPRGLQLRAEDAAAAASFASPCSSANTNTDTRSFAPSVGLAGAAGPSGAAAAAGEAAVARDAAVSGPARKRPRIIVIPSVRPASRQQRAPSSLSQPPLPPCHHHQHKEELEPQQPQQHSSSGLGSDSADESQSRFADPRASFAKSELGPGGTCRQRQRRRAAQHRPPQCGNTSGELEGGASDEGGHEQEEEEEDSDVQAAQIMMAMRCVAAGSGGRSPLRL